MLQAACQPVYEEFVFQKNDTLPLAVHGEGIADSEYGVEGRCCRVPAFSIGESENRRAEDLIA